MSQPNILILQREKWGFQRREGGKHTDVMAGGGKDLTFWVLTVFFPSLLCFPTPRLTGQVWKGRIWPAGPWAPLLHTALTLNVMGSGVQALRPLRFQSGFHLQTCQTRRHHKEQGPDQHLWSPTPPLMLKFRPSDHFTLGFLDKEPKKSISTVDSKSSP